MTAHVLGRLRRTHSFRLITPILLSMVIALTLLPREPVVSAQAMCPIDKIWNEEANACVDLEPSPTPDMQPTATDVPEAQPTISPSPTSEPLNTPPPVPTATVTPEPTTTSSDASATPGTDTGDQFFLEDWWDAIFGFDGPPAPAGLRVFSRLCDQVVDETDTIEEIAPNCREMPHTQGGFDYDIQFNGAYVFTLHTHTPWSWDGHLPGGEVRIVSRYTDDYRTPFAACRGSMVGDDQPVLELPPQPVPVSGHLVVPSVPPGSRLDCTFFYIPVIATEVSVDLIPYTCPQEVVDRNILDYGDLILRCGSANGEVEMQVINGDGVWNAFTRQDVASFRGLSPGPLRVREVIPQGFGVPLVFCTVSGPQGQTIKARDLELIGNNYYVSVEMVPPGSSVLCEFFNVPGDTPKFDSPPTTRWQEDAAA